MQRLNLRVLPFIRQCLRSRYQRLGIRRITFQRKRGRLFSHPPDVTAMPNPPLSPAALPQSPPNPRHPPSPASFLDGRPHAQSTQPSTSKHAPTTPNPWRSLADAVAKVCYDQASLLTLADLPGPFVTVVAVVLGLLFGSFLNVVIYRLPGRELVLSGLALPVAAHRSDSTTISPCSAGSCYVDVRAVARFGSRCAIR